MIKNNELQAAVTKYPYRVLIVDDDSVHRALEQEILQPPKYEVAEALQLLATLSFDDASVSRRYRFSLRTK